MLIVLSPAKTLDFESEIPRHKISRPQFLDEAAQLNQRLRQLSAPSLERLMAISKPLAERNAARNQRWALPFTRRNARQAIFAFRGDVYLGLEADSFSSEDLAYAQKHLRILSGLYGMLRPLDLMQPYRLEMGTRLATAGGSNLYDFWDDKVTLAINKSVRGNEDRVLVNLASQEYFSVLKKGRLDADVITPVFKDWSGGEYRLISFFAKKARGRMAAWILKNRMKDRQQLENFAEDGYAYNAALSQAAEPVFTRKQR